MVAQFKFITSLRFVILILCFFAKFKCYSQVEFMLDFNKNENGSNPSCFQKYQSRIVFYAAKCIYSMDSLGNDLKLVADSLNPFLFIEFTSSTNPFVINGGYIYYISNNKLWRTDLNQFNNLGAYNYPDASMYFAGNMPIVIGSNGAFTPFNSAAALIPIRDDGNLIGIFGFNFIWLPFYDTYKFFPPQRIGNKLYCFNTWGGESLRIFSIQENAIASNFFGSIDNLENEIISEYGYKSFGKPRLFEPIITIENKIYFTISKASSLSTSHNELWKIENEILTKVCDFNPSNSPTRSGFTQRLYELNGKIIIHLSSNGFEELWVSDGTAPNTKILKSFKTEVPIDDTFAAILNNKMYFTANDNNDFEVWETDGTVVNTKLFMDLEVAVSSSPSRFLDFQGGFLFQTRDSSIWISQGEVSNTLKLPIKLKDLRIQKLEKNKFIKEGKYIFGGYDDGVMGSEPTKFDIVNLALSNIVNINNSNESFLYDLLIKYKLNDRYYFGGVYNKTRGIFSTDGTAEGTIRNSPQDIDLVALEVQNGENGLFVREYFDGSSQYGLGFLNLLTNEYDRIDLKKSENVMINPKALFGFDDEVIFVNQNTPTELYRSDDLNKPVLLKEFEVNIESIFSTSSKIFCSANGLWVGDGSAFTQLFNTSDINLPISVTHYITKENKLYLFSKFRNIYNQIKYGLFVSDGTRNGTILIYTFEGVVKAQDFSFFVDQDSIFFALNYNNQTNLYRYETLFGQVTLLSSFDNVIQDSFNNFLKFSKLRNELYLQYNRNNRGFVSKINLDNTVLTIVNEGPPNFQYDLEVLNNVLYFRTTTDEFKYRLMRTDGTGIGTYIISTSFNNNPEFVPRLLMTFENKLLFFSEFESLGAELFFYKPQLCENTINQSVKSGSWTDSSTWSCGSLPNLNKDIIINTNHKVILQTNQIGEAKSIFTFLGSVLEIENGAILTIKPD